MDKVPITVSYGPVQVSVLVDSPMGTGDAKTGDAVNWQQVMAFITALLGFIAQYFPSGETEAKPAAPTGPHPTAKK